LQPFFVPVSESRSLRKVEQRHPRVDISTDALASASAQGNWPGVGRHALVLHDGCMRGVGGCLLAKLVSSGVLRADEPILEASMEMAGKLASAP
jgi:hypothetical protein